MKLNRTLILATMLFLMLGLQSCNLPGMAIPTVLPYSTPDLTLTAIFSPIAPTPTLPPLVQTATALPPVVITQTPAGEAVATQTPLVVPPTNTTAPTQTSIIPPATNTPAPQPTNTLPPPAPASTATRPAVTPTARVNTEMTAKRVVDNPPTIDGNLTEWKLRNSAEKAVYGADRVNSENDSSAAFAVAWDRNYLYVAARVKDQRYVQNASGMDLYKGDSLEILLDANLTGDFYTRELNGDDFQIGISPGSPAPGNNPESWIWYPKKSRGKPAGVNIAAVATADGYDIEAAIPWDLFGINPKGGQHYGFAFSVSDNDKKTGANVQESLVSWVATRKLTDPTTWGDLTIGRP